MLLVSSWQSVEVGDELEAGFQAGTLAVTPCFLLPKEEKLRHGEAEQSPTPKGCTVPKAGADPRSPVTVSGGEGEQLHNEASPALPAARFHTPQRPVVYNSKGAIDKSFHLKLHGELCKLWDFHLKLAVLRQSPCLSDPNHSQR